MNFQPFAEFEDQLRGLLAAGRFNEIVEQIEAQGDRYPEQRLYLYYWQLTMAGRSEDLVAALSLLDGLVEEGLWISNHLLTGSPSLVGFQGDLHYEARLARMKFLEDQERSQLLPLLTLRQGKTDGTNLPLLIGLHKDRGLALSSIKFWQSMARQGWLVAVPQSTQAMWSGEYVWEDRSQAFREIQTHVQGLAGKYPLDPARTLIAGHCGGADLAAWLAVSGGLSSRGFLAISPSGLPFEDLEAWFPLLETVKARAIRGAFLVGQQEDAPIHESLERFVELLNGFGVVCRLQIIPGVGREYDPIYDRPILDALDYILS